MTNREKFSRFRRSATTRQPELYGAPLLPQVVPVRAILLHGLGRTPLAMMILAARLRAAGIKPHMFGYVAAFQTFDACLLRLKKFVEKHTGTGQKTQFVMIGHSLGSVLIRAVVPLLKHRPAYCFFLAPPTTASSFAQALKNRWLFRWLAGDMGQRLADPVFMKNLALPPLPIMIFAGNSGPLLNHLPFGAVPNDGILSLDETRLPGAEWIEVPALHTFIMNSRIVTECIVATVRNLPLLT